MSSNNITAAALEQTTSLDNRHNVQSDTWTVIDTRKFGEDKKDGLRHTICSTESETALSSSEMVNIPKLSSTNSCARSCSPMVYSHVPRWYVSAASSSSVLSHALHQELGRFPQVFSYFNSEFNHLSMKPVRKHLGSQNR